VATGATFSGLPAGVTGSWAGNVVTISGTPTASGTFNYTVTLTGGCGLVISSGTIIVIPNNTVSLSSAAGTDNQTICINTAITSITYATTGATGATVTGLPAGVNGIWAGDVVTISGTPTASGTFNYTVTPTGGCGTITANGTITAAPDNTIALSSAAGTDNQTVCINMAITNITFATTGATGATVTGLPSGVTGGWAVNVVTISGTPTASGPFNYTVTLTGGCGTITANGTITVTPDNTIALSSAAGTDAQTVCINTAITNITYSTTGATGATFSGLPAGVTGAWAGNVVTVSGTPTASGTFNYTVTLTGGCGTITSNGSVIVTPPPVLVINDPSAVCSPSTVDLTNAAVTAGSTAGLTLTYWIDAPATIPYATPSTATTGTYYVKGQDGTGCFDIKPVIVTVNPVPSGTTTVTDILCFSAATGSVDLSVAGGTTPYTFLWSNGAVTEDISGVTSGTYTVLITDANSCTATASGTIAEPATALSGAITSQTDVSVNGGNDGSVTIAGSGGTSPYQYKLDAGVYQVSGTFSSLTAGSYTVTVQDANLCTFDVFVTIIQPNIPLSGTISSQSDVSCFSGADGSITVTGLNGYPPYDYSLNGGVYQSSGTFLSLTAGPYTVTVRDSLVNTFDIAVIITQPASALAVTTTQTDVVCFGAATGTAIASATGGTSPYSYSWNTSPVQSSPTASDLGAGIYTVTITDANGCTATANVTISQPTAITLTITQVNVLCNGGSDGSATVAASGGTGPYTYSWNTSPLQTTATINGLVTGSYTVTVTDSEGCMATGTALITEPGALSLDATPSSASCPDSPDGSITLVITGGTSPYGVIWSDGITTQNRTGLLPTTYSVVVTDANGCAETLDTEVDYTGSFACLSIPQIITPNGDGHNDEWIIKNIDIYPDAEVLVFNRWGRLIYRERNILSNPWDGTFKGKLVPTDSYHYILYLNDGSAPRSGVISVLQED
jgi:gliding motility-associated-like protein